MEDFLTLQAFQKRTLESASLKHTLFEYAKLKDFNDFANKKNE